ncbi:DUF3606 domain-containing protein [Hymenobacter coccineus]|uniref:DUF3606 domain-containing protein n=1 Tax=Hymenobacter coccineus TaxID=1908235 RepID=A0A1G1TJE2_9BACT|nr:DUF3606 domain-containing protein [Hymenobacter coccineus]OGX90994.1 hypothetical protein BEN49_05810 [Hymenobacter coccineus]
MAYPIFFHSITCFVHDPRPFAARSPPPVNVQYLLKVNYWCHVFNCTETRLRNAVLAVGPAVTAVQGYLNRQ